MSDTFSLMMLLLLLLLLLLCISGQFLETAVAAVVNVDVFAAVLCTSKLFLLLLLLLLCALRPTIRPCSLFKVRRHALSVNDFW